MDPKILEMICCPVCKADLFFQSENPPKLQCRGCHLIYSISDNIPQLDPATAQKPNEENPSQ